METEGEKIAIPTKCVDDMTMAEMKEHLKKRGLPVSGNVKALRNRLGKAIEEEEEEELYKVSNPSVCLTFRRMTE